MSSQPSNPALESIAPNFDLMRVPGIGAFLRWRHSRTFLQVPLLILSVVMVLHGLFGPALAPKNLATTLTWVHFRGLLVLVILAAGNFFCLACPFMLVRNAARKFVRPWLTWPRGLRNKWLSIALLVAILFVYELFDLWSSPWWTAWLIVGYFLAILVVDGIFKRASFCKFICPIGQFNFVASLLSPLEVKVRDQHVCTSCHTKDCIRGERAAGPDLVVIQRGCELALFQPMKVGNMDCTFCLDCVHACPHDNVGIESRLPASELMIDPLRSGIGYFSHRKDIAALSLIFTLGALLNAFGMLSPAYALEAWLENLLGIKQEAPILGIIFILFLVIGPLLLLGFATWATRAWAGISRAWLPLMVRYSYALVPLGFGMWLAHYGYHFFTGLYTFIPVTQSALANLGWPILGTPHWTWTGLPLRVVQPLELGFLVLGLAGSLFLVHRFSEEDCETHPRRVFVPWASICVLLWLGTMWLMFQPMEMRTTLMGG